MFIGRESELQYFGRSKIFYKKFNKSIDNTENIIYNSIIKSKQFTTDIESEENAMKYFNIREIHCIEELKKVYFKLAQRIHPDHGGSEEEFKILNSEYQQLFPKFKDIHKNIKPEVKEEYYTAKTSTKECPEDFINIVSILLNIKGIDVELCGRWLWISGDTKPHKEILKALKCSWNAKKGMWSWHYPEDGVYKKNRKFVPMEDIRNMYGSQKFYKEEEESRKMLA